MSEDLMESVAPRLAPPITRQPATSRTSATEDGVDQSVFGVTASVGGVTLTFASDDDE